MRHAQVKVPVALIIFNRPDTTKRVMAEIAKARPSRLLVIADGPRPDHPEDLEQCQQARAVIDEGVNWECEVNRNYSDVNLGCGFRPATGIGWVFEQVEEAIILEDDCVPHPTFFQFCEELLARYREDERVMMISGRNGEVAGAGAIYSYSFRLFMSCWGWATWRRAWRHYDMDITLWPQLRNSGWLDMLGHRDRAEYWRLIFDDAVRRRDRIDYWDYQWLFACWSQSGFAIVPEVNLIQNVGFRGDATHTQNREDPRGRVTARALEFPLRHPPCMIWDRQLDLRDLDRVVAKAKARRRKFWKWRVKQWIKGLIRPFAKWARVAG